ncbi:MAG: DUF2726 domain-containing protein [Clostridia bacterium]|nr:DUF2726 domain-containing protein [Clostridia bacterium]
MECKVCGAESGKYPLCRACNLKKEKGEIIKCSKCNNWHYTQLPCPVVSDNEKFLYSLKSSLISKNEQLFYDTIKEVIPDGFFVFPQINLASFINRTDDARFHNELFRNVDFLITNEKYQPLIVIEINDQTHLNADRKERDEKIQKICQEAGIPIIKLWTSYGINKDYIKAQIEKQLNALPIERIHHFADKKAVETLESTNTLIKQTPTSSAGNTPASQKKSGCYIATCVYGAYDCPPVWTLRRYRDYTLSKTWYGKAFIQIYYSISPTLVRWFGSNKWFKKCFKKYLDIIVSKLHQQGFEDTPYKD